MDNRTAFVSRTQDRVRQALAVGDNDAPSVSNTPADTCRMSTSVEKVVQSILQGAIENHATQAHLMPDADGTHVQFVMAEVTEEMLTLPKALKTAIVASVKKAADIGIAEAGSLPITREGLIPVRFNDKAFQVDVICRPTKQGESVLLSISGG